MLINDLHNATVRRIERKIALIIAISAVTAAGANQFEIVNGSEASPGAYPWLVSIGSAAVPSALDAHRCGGSLVAPAWVLTAAHCFAANSNPAQFAVTVGRHRLTEAGGQRISARQIIRHPAYNETTSDNDIALIELTEPVVGASTVRLAAPATPAAPGDLARSMGRGGLAAPLDYLNLRYPMLTVSCTIEMGACLRALSTSGVAGNDIIGTMLQANGLGDPTRGIGFAELVAAARRAGAASVGPSSPYPEVYASLELARYTLTDMALIVAMAAQGSDEVREVDLPLVDNATCSRLTGISPITDNMLCAGYSATPKDTCQGDSGGPLVLRNTQGTGWVQVGIVSFGGVCAQAPGVYARVAPYVEWVSGLVPHMEEERLFNWGEATAMAVLKAVGTEQSQQIGAYWARCYAASGVCLGSDGGALYFYNGTVAPLGPLGDWVGRARADGY